MACGHSKGHSLQQAIVTAHDHSMTATPNYNWLPTRFRFRQVPFLPLCSSSCDLFCRGAAPPPPPPPSTRPAAASIALPPASAVLRLRAPELGDRTQNRIAQGERVRRPCCGRIRLLPFKRVTQQIGCAGARYLRILSDGPSSRKVLSLPEEQALHQVSLLPWCPRPQASYLRLRQEEEHRGCIPSVRTHVVRREGADFL